MSCGECSRRACASAAAEAAFKREARVMLQRFEAGRVSGEQVAAKLFPFRRDVDMQHERERDHRAECATVAAEMAAMFAETPPVVSLAGSGDSVASEGRTGGAS